MKIQMELLSDTIFGNGMSIPGGEDISILTDPEGFPYYKGGSFKGIFREELLRYLDWAGKDKNESDSIANKLLGFSGDDNVKNKKMTFSDFVLSPNVKKAVKDEIGDYPDKITDAFTNMRTFTAIEDDGVVQEGSLRIARCVNSGITFEGEVTCDKEYETLVKDVLSLIKWVGSMRNRGFGKVKIEAAQEGGKA